MSSQHTVIVGGSSGIGLATARHLLASGARVTITGRDGARLAHARAQVGTELRVMEMDAAASASLPALFGQIGPFDHLVLALGSGRGIGPFATVSLADVRLGFEEKVYAHFAAAQAALPFLSGTGSLTFISAIQAARPGTAGIAAANAAVSALVPVLAAELKPRRVNAGAPGVIDTPWWDAMPGDQTQAIFEELTARTPVGRVGRPEDVADTIAFLIGNDFINGQVVTCDGGLRLAA